MPSLFPNAYVTGSMWAQKRAESKPELLQLLLVQVKRNFPIALGIQV